MLISIEKDWIAALFAVIGILLIVFPDELTNTLPYLLGAALLLHALISSVVFWKYRDAGSQPGKIVIYAAIGAALFHHNENAIGTLGAIWAVLSLRAVAEEINDCVQNNRYPPLQIAIMLASTGLAILLLFNPFAHFTTRVRVLGMELIALMFVRRYGTKK